MAWKKEYAENRKLKASLDPEYRERRNAQGAKDKGARKEYMREYYKKNPEKFGRRTPEQRARYNEARRKRYAEDKEYREAHKASVKEWQATNPGKRKQTRISIYGIGLSDYQEMLAMQNGRCAICGYSDMSNPNFFPLVDHCHKTGKVRGLLCLNCNHALGKFKDDPGNLLAAIAYLSRHS